LKGLYHKNYKIPEKLNTQKIGKSSLIIDRKKLCCKNAIYRFNTIPIKITMAFFTKIIKKKIFKFIKKQKAS
jgi:hypothetical protein